MPNMTSAVERLPKSTIKITITLPWSEVKESYENVILEIVQEAEIAGFRKGKAPRKLVEEKTDKTKIYDEVINKLLPKAYADSIKDHSLNPIVSPRVKVTKADEGKDWQFEAITCEKPAIILKDYKGEISKLKKVKKIWVPGADNKKKDEEDKKGIELSEVLKVLLTNSEIEIPDILVEDQVNRKLSQLIDEVKQLGMTVEQYLLSKGLTSQQLRTQYQKEAAETLKLEFILEEVADKEKVVVEDREIDEAISAIKDEKQKEDMRKQRYYISMILRRQKTLDTLLKPIV